MLGKHLKERYQLEAELGRGAMGIVYRALDTRLNRLVAIKILFSQVDEESLTRFYREAEAAARLNHPHVMTLFDLDEADGRPFLVMEYIEGQTLRAYIGSAAEIIVQLASQVCDGLAVAHENGLVHRDIKPENILVSQYGIVKIADFGLALLQDSTRITRNRASMGSPAYMAPEQLAADPIDGRADLFSLGVVLYELLSAKLPFSNKNLFSVYTEPALPLARHRPQTPPALEKVVMRLLEKEPARRYPTALEVKVALRQALMTIDDQSHS
jgi:eukaryotic-like serine/threonine-protein kinase